LKKAGNPTGTNISCGNLMSIYEGERIPEKAILGSLFT
jgi:hypothetical protein